MSSGKCAVCLEEKPKIVNCGRCGNRPYCGAACQRKDWPTHKAACQPRKEKSWILKITLPDSSDPQITRTLVCPDTATFDQLHRAIQIAFGWATTHGYDFVARDPTAEEPPIEDVLALMKRRMGQDTGRPVNHGPRQNFVRLTNAASQNASMVDTIHEKYRMHPETPEKDAAKLYVGEQFRRKEYQTAEWEYVYDFGNSWGHEIEIEGRGGVDDGFQCITGNGHGVAEDAGGMHGWDELKNAYRAANPTKDQGEKMHWFERQASNADPKGLKEKENFWDKDAINARLQSLG